MRITESNLFNDYDYEFRYIRTLKDSSFCCQTWILFFKGQVHILPQRANRILLLQSKVSCASHYIPEEDVWLPLRCPVFSSKLLCVKLASTYSLLIICEMVCISAMSVKFCLWFLKPFYFDSKRNFIIKLFKTFF